MDRDTAERRWREVVRPRVLGDEEVPLAGRSGGCWPRTWSAAVDVPAFDRSNVDGYAVRAGETFGASEEEVRALETQR